MTPILPTATKTDLHGLPDSVVIRLQSLQHSAEHPRVYRACLAWAGYRRALMEDGIEFDLESLDGWEWISLSFFPLLGTKQPDAP